MRTKDVELMKKIETLLDREYFSGGGKPSMRQMADKLGVAKSTVCKYVQAMAANGMLSAAADGATTAKIAKAETGLVRLPVVGVVACGAPILAEQNVEYYLTISSTLIGQGEHFVLKAKGDSMTGAGIDDGDLVIVRRQCAADDGQIVVALTGDEATLKRYYRDEKSRKVRLHPENERYGDMYFDDVAVLGVAKKVLKDVE